MSERPSVLASGARVTTDTATVMQYQRTRQAAQRMCWQYHRGIGVVWYSGTFKANAISRLQIFPAEITASRQDPSPVDDLNSLQQVTLDDLAAGYSGLSLGHAPMLGMLAMHDSVAGECHWWSTSDEATGKNVHEILSTEELIYTGGTYQVRRYPGAIPIPIKPTDLLVRLWTPDPSYKELATSPLFVQQDTLEELWLLLQAGIAAAKSRLASAGILTIPEELDYQGSVKSDGTKTEFEEELLQVGTASIRDPRGAGRWFPVTLRGKSDYLKPEFLRWVPFFKDMPKELIDRIDALRTRFAHDIDLPTELVTGLGDMTHWNAWIVDSMTWPHLEPIAQRILANLSTYVYQPLLIAGGMDPQDAARQVIWYDESLVVAKPDRSAAADIGIQNGSLSDQAWRRAHGFQEDDAPSDEEKARMFGWRWGDPGLAGSGDWTKATGRIATRVTEAAPAGEGPVDVVSPDAGPSPSEAGPPPPVPEAAPTPLAPPASPPAITPAPGIAASGNGHGNGYRKPLARFAALPVSKALEKKRSKLRRLGIRLGRLDRDLLERLSVLADERLHALVKTAGNKLRSAAQGRPLVESIIRGLDPIMVPRQLGQSGSHALGLDEHVMVDAAAVAYARKALPWFTVAQLAALSGIADATGQDLDALEETTEVDRSEWAIAAERILTAGFAAQALGFLYNPDGSQPQRGEVSDIVAPRASIRQALSVAGGADPGLPGPSLGVGGGPMVASALGDGGAQVDGWRWIYNDLARTTFPGHLQLDGIEFASWDDDQLLVQPEDSWLDTDFYAPNDHEGCACTVEQILIPVEEASGGEGADYESVGAEA
jgi:hypothetical protein